MNHHQILQDVAQYYTAKLAQHGPTPQGVDWNSAVSQTLRFEQITRVCQGRRDFTLLDYGCGYGALWDWLQEQQTACAYRGFDISEPMIQAARRRHAGAGGCEFFTEPSQLAPADFAVASGIFNVRQETSDPMWKQYMQDTVARLAELGRSGFAFNALTSYSDRDRMRADLHYADPLFWFDHCKRNYSKQVALLHDYPLYEFTILVRR